MRSAAGVGGRALVSGASNGQQGFGALRVDVVPEQAEALSFRVQGSYGRAASLQTPDYILGNTGSEQLNLGASVQLQGGAAVPAGLLAALRPAGWHLLRRRFVLPPASWRVWSGTGP